MSASTVRSRRLALVLGCLGCLAAPTPQARAAGGTLVDQAVTLSYPATRWGPAPAADLTGTEPTATTDILYNSGWWYRVEGDTREYPLPPPDNESYTGGDYAGYWANLDGKGFELQLREYALDHEGPSGGFWSHLLAINHGSTRGLALFHYLDVDAAGTPANDVGQPLSSRYVEQTEAGGPGAVRYRALSVYEYTTSILPVLGFHPILRNALNDDSISDFFPAGGSVGPGDVTAVYQFKTVQDLTAGQALDASVTVYSNMPSRHVKGAHTDRTPFPVLLYHDTFNYRTQTMRRASMLQDSLQNDPLAVGVPAGLDDFDGDYANDVLYRHPGTGAVRIDDDPLAGATPPALSWIVTATGDFNADGRADILWRNNTSQKLVVWFMNGATRIGTQAPSPDQAVNANWNAAGTGDFNGDGFRDILWYNQTTGKIVVWYMDGALQRITGGFTDPASVGNNNWKVVALGDYGKGPAGALPPVWNATDIVWQNDNSYKIVIWFMDQQGRRTSGVFTSPDAFGIWENVVGPR